MRAVLGLDDDVGRRERAVEVTALVLTRLLDELPPRDGLVRVEERLERLPRDGDRLDGGSCLLGGVRRDGRQGGARVARLVLQELDVLVRERGVHARQLERRAEVERARPFATRAAEDGGVHHSRQGDVGREPRLAPGPLKTVLARRGPADDVERARRPLIEGVLVDDGPDLLVAALDLLLSPDQPRHVRIASSIAGYVPHRHRFPAMPCRMSSRVGAGSLATSAAADTI